MEWYQGHLYISQRFKTDGGTQLMPGRRSWVVGHIAIVRSSHEAGSVRMRLPASRFGQSDRLGQLSSLLPPAADDFAKCVPKIFVKNGVDGWIEAGVEVAEPGESVEQGL